MQKNRQKKYHPAKRTPPCKGGDGLGGFLKNIFVFTLILMRAFLPMGDYLIFKTH